MSDLVEFIKARLDEDERDAQEVERLIESGMEVPGAVTYSPARVLREVEAKRRMLAWHDLAHPHDEDPCTLQRLLVLPYADHSDYDEDWRPA